MSWDNQRENYILPFSAPKCNVIEELFGPEVKEDWTEYTETETVSVSSHTDYKNICKKAMPCISYPKCRCKNYDYKKVLCQKFPYCSEVTCVFAHEELAHKYKTNMCKFGADCVIQDNCPFAHTEVELRSFNSPIKGYTLLPRFQVFERNSALNPELRLISRKMDLILATLDPRNIA